jgi:hypothetical protein
MLRNNSIFKSVTEQINKTALIPIFRTSKEETSPPSWFSTLTQSTGWFNPYSISRENASRIFYAIYFLNNCMLGNANACFASYNPDVDYLLSCADRDTETKYSPVEEELLGQLTIKNCDLYIQNQCPHLSNDKLVGSFGPGYFGGFWCTIYSSDQPSSCVMDVLQNYTPSGYGTSVDIGATVGIALASVVSFGVFCYGGCYGIDKCEKRVGYLDLRSDEVLTERTRLLR